MSRDRLKATVAEFLADKRGGTAIEYAMIAAGIGVVIASTVWALGSDIKANLWDKVAAVF